MLLNITTGQVVLHNRVAKARLSLPEKTNAVVGFDGKIAVFEHGQTEEA